MPKANAASRLLVIATKARDLGDFPNVAEGWANILGVLDPTEPARDLRVVSWLAILHEQLALLRTNLLANSVTPSTYETAVARLENALSLRLLPHAWKNIRDSLNPETMAVLVILPELLDDDGSGFVSSDVAELSEELERVQRLIEASGLPDELRAFLLRQLDHVRHAIHEWPLRGGKAFEDASDRAASDWLSVGPLFADHGYDPAVRATWDLWPFIEKWGKRALILGGLAKFAYLDSPLILQHLRSLPALPPGSSSETPRESPELPASVVARTKRENTR